MRGGFAWPLLAFAASFCAAPALAQPEAVPPPSPPAERPVLSLVVARAHAALPFPDFYGPSSCVACLNPIHIGAFDSAQTLYGPPVAPEFGATMYWHSWFTHGRHPMLLVVQHLGNGGYHVAAYARGPGADGMGCLPREEIAHLDWHPAGAGIVARDGGLCASLAAIAALPPRPDPRFDTPVVTVSAEDLRRMRPSLIVARRRGLRDAGPMPCATSANCLGVTVDARMVDVETLSGPRVPPTVMVRFVGDSPLPAGGDLIMVVRRDVGGRWTSDRFQALETGGRETCLPSDHVWSFNLRGVSFSYRRGDQTCFQL